MVHRTILEKKISKRHVAKIFTDKKPISAFFERIWLLLSKIYFFGSEVKHPAQTLLYRPIHVFFCMLYTKWESYLCFACFQEAKVIKAFWGHFGDYQYFHCFNSIMLFKSLEGHCLFFHTCNMLEPLEQPQTRPHYQLTMSCALMANSQSFSILQINVMSSKYTHVTWSLIYDVLWWRQNILESRRYRAISH